jgi:thiol-disulfide isomerase/thioredoxin
MTNLSPIPEKPAGPETLEEFRALGEARRRRTLVGIVVAGIAALTVVFAVGWVVDGNDADSVFPTGVLTTPEGEEFDLVSLRGQPSVVNFFASWCAPCRAEMPDFEQVHQKRSTDVAFVGINAGETSTDDALALVDSTGVTYTILIGAPSSMVEDLGGIGMPFTVFVDAEGNITDTHIGPLDAEALEARIDDLVS